MGASTQPSDSPVKILIAEDSLTQAQRLQHILQQHGYHVTVTTNGRQALEAARQSKPTLIISDVIMPELDGYDLCKAIKTDKKLKDIPVMLVTTLSDPQDVIRGLECGADNFLRKPYDERYLLSRIDYLLMNLDLRKNQKMQMGMEIDLGGQKHFISSERQQILDLLISTYEQAVEINSELKQREKELAHSNQVVNSLYRIADGLNHATSEREVVELALERALELPGIQAGWIFLREGESGFRLAAARNLPPTLEAAGAMEGDCTCRRRLDSGELDHVTNILECERLGKTGGDTRGLRNHASVPLWLGGRTLGLMNLVGPEKGLFSEDELKVLHSVGNQVAVALERAHLHEHLERLVQERTAALTAEIAERKRAEKRFHTLFDLAPDAVVMIDQQGSIALVNRQAETVFGYQRDELLGQPVEILMPEAFRRAHVDLRQGFLGNAIPRAMGADRPSLLGLRKDGTSFPVDVSLSPIESEGGIVVAAAVRDVTQRKAHEARIVRLNHIYSVLSGINTTIVRVRKPQELFDEACRIAVEHGKFTFAWIGTFDASTQQVTPVAMAGRDDGYLSRINLSVAEDAPGNCPLTAEAITQAKPVICNDIAADEAMQSLRAEALSRGYRSVAVFPLMLEVQPVGVFVLYAPETDVFDEEEMRLLIEMAGDISFALDHLEKEERLNYLAYFDALTGLPNRTLFQDRVEQRIGAAHRDRKVFSVIMLDLERFGSINESLGRQAGDNLLRQLAQRLKLEFTETDILARLSADYFGVAIWHDDEGADIAHALEKVLSGIQKQPFLIGGQELRVSARAGISSYPADGEDIETLLRNAEAALKKTKFSGDKYLFYAPEFNAQVAEKLTLENKLRQALEQEQLVLHYQPKVNLKNGQICGLEALLRWNDPETGLVPPMKFIPLLEETGMILEAGRWVLAKAVSDSLAWQSKGLGVPRIAVNVSPIQLQQKDFVSMVAQVISGAGNTAVELELEITESLIMHDIEANIQKLRDIREMGIEVAIDDFGTGYSSLSYIAKLPVNALKIDRAFIMNLMRNPGDVSIVTTIISLAHSLDLKVIAEGVETLEQANLLKLLKCDEMQGYLFSPAVPAEQIEQFLREKKALPG